MDTLVSIRNVTKYYGDFCALEDVSFEVSTGRIFAVLGPNGAGKSTLVKCLLNLVSMKSGEILVAGESCLNKESRASVSYLPEKFSFFPFYKVKAVIDFFANLKGLQGSHKKSEIERVVELMGLDEIINQKVSSLSKGQLQRVGLAMTLMGDAKLIILDEPFSGLDPIAIKELKESLLKEKEKGKTIFVNSHLLNEMEKLCDSCVLLNKGRMLANGELEEMLGDLSLEDYFYQKVQSNG